MASFGRAYESPVKERTLPEGRPRMGWVEAEAVGTVLQGCVCVPSYSPSGPGPVRYAPDLCCPDTGRRSCSLVFSQV